MSKQTIKEAIKIGQDPEPQSQKIVALPVSRKINPIK